MTIEDNITVFLAIKFSLCFFLQRERERERNNVCKRGLEKVIKQRGKFYWSTIPDF